MTARSWRRLALVAYGGIVGLHLAWHLWLAPPERSPLAFVLALALGPALGAGLAMLIEFERGLFWAGFAALAYFCHGIMEAWSTPAVRGLAHVEWLLSAFLVIAVGAAGHAERRASPSARGPT